MVELGERMLLVAILGTVTVLGAFISITTAQAGLQLALSFTTDTKVHRMNWVSHALRPPLACALCPRPCARAHAPIRAAVPSAGAYSSSGGGLSATLCNSPTLPKPSLTM